jgi:hypothetical protein
MKYSFFIIPILLFGSVVYGQKENVVFEATKGKWHFPIPNVQSIDTMMRDCFGIPANSSILELMSNNPQEIRAIQPGLVKVVTTLQGVYMVLTKSGEYFLVYYGIANPGVKKGDFIQEGDVIGTMSKEEEEKTYKLTLMLLKGSNTININRWFDWRTAHNTALDCNTGSNL